MFVCVQVGVHTCNFFKLKRAKCTGGQKFELHLNDNVQVDNVQVIEVL